MNITEHHSGKKYIQPTWRGMCYVMLVREGIVPNKENIRQYQVERLGRHNGETLLTELLPLPRKRVARLQYKVLKTKFRSTEEYQNELVRKRVNLLSALFQENPPDIVICYGKRFWAFFRDIFVGAHFVPDRDGLFERAQIGKTRIILSYHFTHPKMYKKLRKLAKIVLEYSN